VLLDMRMPKVDGLEVVKAIKQNSPKTKIMVITGFRDTYLERVKESGVDGFFVKPVRLDAIIKRMKELLEEKRPPSWSWKAKADEIGDRVIKARLLFVEDPNPHLPFIPLDDLIQSGMQIETQFVYSQNEALNKFKEFEPDIVVMAMSVPKEEGSKSATHTVDITDNALELLNKGAIKAVISHTRRDVLEEEFRDKLEQYYNEMRDSCETQFDDFSPQERCRHFEKLKARIIEACIEKGLFTK